jgi:hypothetical protein
MYVGPDFRLSAESRIARMWPDSVGACIETHGAYGLVDPTLVCNRTQELSSERLAAQHSQAVFNEEREGYQLVFFKESMKTFVRTNGGIGFHYINFTRAGDLGRVKRWLGRGRIEASQRKTVEELRSWLLFRNPVIL